MSNATRDYGDLRVTMTSAYNWAWNDSGSGASRDGEFYHPQSQGNMRPLGSVGFGSYGARNGKRATLLVGNNPSSGRAAVASPTSYTLIWKDEKSGAKVNGSVWRPNPPSGYTSLGDVFLGTWHTPSTDLIWCVRSDLVKTSDYATNSFWSDENSGAKADCATWDIAVPSIGTNGSEDIPISADTFRAVSSRHVPPPRDQAKVLILPNAKRFTDYDTPPPTFTKDTIPRGGDTFYKVDQCQITLPFIAFFPPTDRECLGAIENPFCTLSRQIAWYVHACHTNNSRGEISDSTTVTTGVSKTESQSMEHSAGVSVDASFGIKGFGMGISLNYQFTSSRSSDYTEYQDSTRQQGYTVPPYHATVFLIRRIWLKATRGDGSYELRQLSFNANEDIHLVGIDLK